jgi:hypothetical protein
VIDAEAGQLALYPPSQPPRVVVQDFQKATTIMAVIAWPDFMKLLWGIMREGKEKKKLSTTDQVKNRRKRLKQKVF